MNQKMRAILAESVMDNKLELIGDIFRVLKQLYAFGFEQHIAAITQPGVVFDDLYELDTEELLLRLSVYHGEMSMKARELGGFNTIKNT